MLRPLLIVGAVGVGGYVIWQILWAFVLPMLAGLLGFLWMVVKVGLLVLAAYWVYRMFLKGTSNTKEEVET
jgi:membrane protein implicated in regulation of membrane protease activity